MQKPKLLTVVNIFTAGSIATAYYFNWKLDREIERSREQMRRDMVELNLAVQNLGK